MPPTANGAIAADGSAIEALIAQARFEASAAAAGTDARRIIELPMIYEPRADSSSPPPTWLCTAPGDASTPKHALEWHCRKLGVPPPVYEVEQRRSDHRYAPVRFPLRPRCTCDSRRFGAAPAGRRCRAARVGRFRCVVRLGDGLGYASTAWLRVKRMAEHSAALVCLQTAACFAELREQRGSQLSVPTHGAPSVQ